MRLLALGVTAAVGVTATLGLSGCSSGERQSPGAGGSAELGAVSDINPQDPATLKQGGDLRLAIGALPANFNTLNIDGKPDLCG